MTKRKTPSAYRLVGEGEDYDPDELIKLDALYLTRRQVEREPKQATSEPCSHEIIGVLKDADDQPTDWRWCAQCGSVKTEKSSFWSRPVAEVLREKGVL